MAEPKGWSFDKRRKSRPYKSQIIINGHIEFLGHYDTPEEAHEAFLKKRAENPKLPHSGGAQKGTYTPPRVFCPNCKRDYAKPKFTMHYEACIRNYPDGYSPWMPAPKRKKPQYIKKGEQNGKRTYNRGTNGRFT